MIIKLYKTSSDPVDVDKNITSELTVEATLKGECSITHPQLLLKKGSNGFFVGYNYMYIPDLKRYYYIDNMSFVPGEYVVFDTSVDVLMSFKSQIRSINALIDRQEYIYNPYIADNFIKVAQGMVIKAVDCGLVGDVNYTTYITTIGG